jgi:hypothetical protein
VSLDSPPSNSDKAHHLPGEFPLQGKLDVSRFT